MPSPPIKYKRLKQCHPSFNALRLRILKALYRGGSHLLTDEQVMTAIFPKYAHEKDVVYEERKRRAFYENLFGLVVNQTSAGLAQDPVRLAPQTTEPGATVTDFWQSFQKCATAVDEDGSEHRSLDQVIRDLCVEGVSCGWSWLQVELPKSSGTATSRAEQDVSGELNAYLCTWPTDQVTDWEERDGKLLWLRTYECVQFAEHASSDRDVKTHRWTVWTADDCTVYEVEESKSLTSPKRLPGDDEMVTPKPAEPHTFGRVPWIRFDVCASGTYLHIGDFIESSCRSYFNRTNGEAFQWTQYNFQQLYEFLAPESPGIDSDVSEAQKDPNRANRGKRGPGQVHVRGHQDKAEFIGPNMAGADSGRQAVQDLRDSILRMVTQMALSQDTSGAMLRRSGDSKAQDAQAQMILLGAIGKRLLSATMQVVAMVAAIRQEDPVDVPNVEGYTRFSITDADALVAQAVQLEQVSIPSATFQVERKFQMACTVLGDAISPDTKQKMHDELAGAITQDNLTWTVQPEQPPEEPDTSEEPPTA
jgi:hypothetical protein